MLSTPSFLADLIEKLLRIADKINNNSALKLLIASTASSTDWESAASEARSTLLKFQFQMYDLEDLFADAMNTEFLIVTVPTELAVRESIRLLNDLTFESPDLPIKVRSIVVNQVLADSDAKVFLNHLETSQQRSLTSLEQIALNADSKPIVTKVPYIDTEPRGVFGLKVLSDALLKREQIETP
jgi:arsenite-transporting ATPase